MDNSAAIALLCNSCQPERTTWRAFSCEGIALDAAGNQVSVPRASSKVQSCHQEVIELDVEDKSVIEERDEIVKHIARTYEAFLEGYKKRFVDFESALELQKLLDAIKKASWSG